MKKYTKKIMAIATVAATMVTGTALPLHRNLHMMQLKALQTIMQMNLPWNTKILLEMS